MPARPLYKQCQFFCTTVRSARPSKPKANAKRSSPMTLNHRLLRKCPTSPRDRVLKEVSPLPQGKAVRVYFFRSDCWACAENTSLLSLCARQGKDTGSGCGACGATAIHSTSRSGLLLARRTCLFGHGRQMCEQCG